MKLLELLGHRQDLKHLVDTDEMRKRIVNANGNFLDTNLTKAIKAIKKKFKKKD